MSIQLQLRPFEFFDPWQKHLEPPLSPQSNVRYNQSSPHFDYFLIMSGRLGLTTASWGDSISNPSVWIFTSFHRRIEQKWFKWCGLAFWISPVKQREVEWMDAHTNLILVFHFFTLWKGVLSKFRAVRKSQREIKGQNNRYHPLVLAIILCSQHSRHREECLYLISHLMKILSWS
jgi:hypothetical protein